MRIGDAIRIRNVRAYFPSGNKANGGWIEYRAPKDKNFVFVLMGVEPIKADNSNSIRPDKVLRDLGWEPVGEEIPDARPEEEKPL